jgi:hypothetical protein
MKTVFRHVDLNGDGTLAYNEFCQLSEENRIDLCPYNGSALTSNSFSVSESSHGHKPKTASISKRFQQFKIKKPKSKTIHLPSKID